MPLTPPVGDKSVTVEIDGEEAEYAGWFNGKNEKCVKVEIIFDYMCPGCKRHLTGIPVLDSNENQVDSINIFEFLEQEKLDDGTSYLDAIDLNLTPFPFYGHPYTDEQIQTYLVLRQICEENANRCFMNEYMMLAFANQEQNWAR